MQSTFWQQGLTGPQCITRYYANPFVKKALDKFKVFHFARAAKSETVVKRMRKDGYIPAGLAFLREFGFVFGHTLPSDTNVTALAECVNATNSQAFAATLVRDEGSLAIFLLPPPDKWLKGHDFLGVLESAVLQEPEVFSSKNQKAYATLGKCPN